jgi:hypothetical protein
MPNALLYAVPSEAGIKARQKNFLTWGQNMSLLPGPSTVTSHFLPGPYFFLVYRAGQNRTQKGQEEFKSAEIQRRQ